MEKPMLSTDWKYIALKVFELSEVFDGVNRQRNEAKYALVKKISSG